MHDNAMTLNSVVFKLGVMPGSLLQFHHAGVERHAYYILSSIVQKPWKQHVLVLAYTESDRNVNIFVDADTRLPKILTSQHLFKSLLAYDPNPEVSVDS